MLNKLKKSQKGFTLIELLIVVAIIGILAAIAIPQFASYREKAFNSAGQTDLRNTRIQVEAYYAENYHYPFD
jgi:prepilin-type N-terminal cleavage/methylation domain-containing protein